MERGGSSQPKEGRCRWRDQILGEGRRSDGGGGQKGKEPRRGGALFKQRRGEAWEGWGGVGRCVEGGEAREGGLVPAGGGQRGWRGNDPAAARAGDAVCPHRRGVGIADAWGPTGSRRGREERGAGVRGPTREKAEWAETG
jgi:hypothetical protein